MSHPINVSVISLSVVAHTSCRSFLLRTLASHPLESLIYLAAREAILVWAVLPFCTESEVKIAFCFAWARSAFLPAWLVWHGPHCKAHYSSIHRSFHLPLWLPSPCDFLSLCTTCPICLAHLSFPVPPMLPNPFLCIISLSSSLSSIRPKWWRTWFHIFLTMICLISSCVGVKQVCTNHYDNVSVQPTHILPICVCICVTMKTVIFL